MSPAHRNVSPVPSQPSVGLRSLGLTAAEDLIGGLSKAYLWGRLGWLDVKRRYRRALLGPFWTSISLAILRHCGGSRRRRIVAQGYRGISALAHQRNGCLVVSADDHHRGLRPARVQTTNSSRFEKTGVGDAHTRVCFAT